MRTKDLLSEQTVTDIFTLVFVLVDDYLQASTKQRRFRLPNKANQKASYSELLTIVLVGEILQQKNQGLWYLMVQSDYRELFPGLSSAGFIVSNATSNASMPILLYFLLSMTACT